MVSSMGLNCCLAFKFQGLGSEFGVVGLVFGVGAFTSGVVSVAFAPGTELPKSLWDICSTSLAMGAHDDSSKYFNKFHVWDL